MTVGANSLTSRANRPPTAGPATPILQFRAFVEGFRHLGYDVDRHLVEVGCPMSEFENPDGQISCEICGAFFARTQQVRPIKNLWAHMGAATPIGVFKLLDYLVMTTDTVGEALAQLSRYFKISGAPCTVEIKADEDPVRMVLAINGTALKESAEYGVALNIFRLRSETDGRVAIDHVSFVHQPDDVRDLEQLFGCEVRVNGSWAGVALPREAMNIPLRRRDPILREMLEQQAAPVASGLPEIDGGALDVRRAISSRLAKGQTDIDVIARDLGTSSRTLQRRLSSAGVSYQDLLDHVRRDAAERYIGSTPLSIGEIAYLLGYSEPAAFHRAFKRWHDVTPQAFREQRRRSV